MRGQFFWDGNKRTSLMLANKILIVAGAGILTITDKYIEKFNTVLLNYYNTGDSDELKGMIKNICILNLLEGYSVLTEKTGKQSGQRMALKTVRRLGTMKQCRFSIFCVIPKTDATYLVSSAISIS